MTVPPADYVGAWMPFRQYPAQLLGLLGRKIKGSEFPGCRRCSGHPGDHHVVAPVVAQYAASQQPAGFPWRHLRCAPSDRGGYLGSDVDVQDIRLEYDIPSVKRPGPEGH